MNGCLQCSLQIFIPISVTLTYTLIYATLLWPFSLSLLESIVNMSTIILNNDFSIGYRLEKKFNIHIDVIVVTCCVINFILQTMVNHRYGLMDQINHLHTSRIQYRYNVIIALDSDSQGCYLGGSKSNVLKLKKFRGHESLLNCTVRDISNHII